MPRYDAVLFDMDGTLLDTVEDIRSALNQALFDAGYPTHSRDAVAGFLGSGAYQLMQRALPRHTETETIRNVLSVYRGYYQQRISEKTVPYPGVLPMLSALDEAGLKLAIISNKGDANVKLLTKTHFGSLINIAVGARADVPIKPAPDMLHIALHKLGTAPERTLYIGDAPTDLQAADNAGMECILARWGYNGPEALSPLMPLHFANDPAELPMLILQQED